MACAQLTTLDLPDVKVTVAAQVAAATTGAVRAPHCKVTGVIGAEIKFSLLLPDDWNQKFMMGGGGGFVGTHRQSGDARRSTPGYATVGTDTGHQAAASSTRAGR